MMLCQGKVLGFHPHLQADDDGKPRQRNQGKWPFKLEEAGNTIVLTLVIGKFMRMEDIEIDVQTSYVCISVKVRHKLSRPCRPCVNEALKQRSQNPALIGSCRHISAM
jgi:HSP20 family molecular chaperone IbpA